MLDFKVALLAVELHLVELLEVLVHRDEVIIVPVLKSEFLRVLVKVDAADGVGPPLSVQGHHHRLLKLNLDLLPRDLLLPLLDDVEAGRVGQELGNVVDDQVQPLLKNPRTGEEPRPHLHVVDNSPLVLIEESRVPANLL